MQDLIFVYGSLLTRAAHPMGDKLRREATLVGAASIQGRLYRVSWYPGVVLSDNPADHVYGEVYRLAEPLASLRWLDEYEGITPGPTGVAESDQYERRIVRVRLESGEPLDAWMYLYRRPVTDLERVASGHWATDA